MTFYVWPITCAFTFLNGTATVNGANQLVSFSTDKANDELLSPFNLSATADPLVQSWSELIETIQELEFGGIRNVLFELNYMEDELLPLLNASSGIPPSHYALSSSAVRFAAFGDTLSRMTGNAYALLLESLRSPAATDSEAPVWNPPKATMTLAQPELYGRIRLNGEQIVIGLISSLALVACFFHAVGTYKGPEYEEMHHEDDLIGGNALDIVTVLHHSSLPAKVCGRDGDNYVGGTRRSRAEDIVAEYVQISSPVAFSNPPVDRLKGGVLDLVKPKSISLDELESFPVCARPSF